MSLATATADVLQAFTDAGVRAVDDARDINTPCVYLLPPEGNLRFSKGHADVTWTAYLITADTGARNSVKALSDLLDKIAGKFPVTTFSRRALALPSGGDPLPAYEFTWKSLIPIGAGT